MSLYIFTTQGGVEEQFIPNLPKSFMIYLAKLIASVGIMTSISIGFGVDNDELIGVDVELSDY